MYVEEASDLAWEIEKTAIYVEEASDLAWELEKRGM